MLAHFTGFSISTDVGSRPMTDSQSRQSLEVASYPFGLWPIRLRSVLSWWATFLVIFCIVKIIIYFVTNPNLS